MQRNRYETSLVKPEWDIRENETLLENHYALLEAKDQTIAELKEQVAFLRRQLERKNDLLLRIAEGRGKRPAPVSKSPNGRDTVNPEEGGDSQVRGVSEVREEPERPALPSGYRLVATASDAWVLIAPRGLRVAIYRGGLDLRKAASDARQHHKLKQ